MKCKVCTSHWCIGCVNSHWVKIWGYRWKRESVWKLKLRQLCIIRTVSRGIFLRLQGREDCSLSLSDRVQDKEKDLKRDYRMLRDARKQSGVGWDEERCMIQAEPHLWDNLEIVSCFILTYSWYKNLVTSFIIMTFIHEISSFVIHS
jgi:hypothetical protein